MDIRIFIDFYFVEGDLRVEGKGRGEMNVGWKTMNFGEKNYLMGK